MLEDELSTHDDQKRKTLLKPAEETAQLRQGAAGFSRVQIGVRRVELSPGMRPPMVSVWLRVGVAVGGDSGPPGGCTSTGLPRLAGHGYPHLVALRLVGSSGSRGRCSGKLWLQSWG